MRTASGSFYCKVYLGWNDMTYATQLIELGMRRYLAAWRDHGTSRFRRTRTIHSKFHGLTITTLAFAIDKLLYKVRLGPERNTSQNRRNRLRRCSADQAPTTPPRFPHLQKTKKESIFQILFLSRCQTVDLSPCLAEAGVRLNDKPHSLF